MKEHLAAHAPRPGLRPKRILLGVTGEGWGHTMRARTLAQRLVARGHTVKVAASGRAVPVLRGHGLDVVAIHGLALSYSGGSLQRGRSVLRNLRHAPRALRGNVDVALSEMAAFLPDGVVTDFDSFAWAVGHLMGVPVVSFDHQHVLDRFVHPPAILRATSRGYAATRALVRAKTPGCDRFVVTSFFFPDVRASTAAKTTLVGPVVRPEIEAAAPTEGDAVLVYQTASGDPALLPALAAWPKTRFVVYGAGLARAPANVGFRAFDEASFVRDLAGARAVVANGGFTTLAESVWLGKPVLAVPVRRQAEQELNAGWLDWLGLGMRADHLSPAVLGRFLARVAGRGFERMQDTRFWSGPRDACEAVERALGPSRSDEGVAA